VKINDEHVSQYTIYIPGFSQMYG